jgi:hypothetical protein
MSFKDFTNQYELLKTLRFELLPIGKRTEVFDKKTGETKQVSMTEKLLLDNKVFEKDEIIVKNYIEAKKYFNDLHRIFIDDALNVTSIPINLIKNFQDKYFFWKENKNKANAKNLESDSKKLRTKILEEFNKKAEKWINEYAKTIEDEKKRKKIKELRGLDLFFKVEIFDFLKHKYPEAKLDEKSIFNPFNKFGGYFKKFHKTRENFYKDDGTSTAIPTRIIKNNLPKFLYNKNIFEEKYLKKHSQFFSEKEKKIFRFEHFNNCLTQKQIEEYNNVVASLKSKINELRQQNPDNKKELPFFKMLFKQILGQQSKHPTEQDDFIEILSDADVFPTLQKFIDENKKYIPKAKTLFNNLIASQKQGTEVYNIKEIYVASRFINTISNKWFISWNTIRRILCTELKFKKNQKIPDFISLDSLKNTLKESQEDIDAKDLFRDEYKENYASESDFYQIFLKIWEREFNDKLKEYDKETENMESIIEKDKRYLPNKKGKLRNEKEGSIQKEAIQSYTASAKAIYDIMKYFSLEKGSERDWNPDGLNEDSTGGFYDDFNKYYENIHTWKYFNEFRNYLTKKPYNEDKIKLNFDCSSLLNGWAQTYESNGALIFKSDDKYYLGIINGTKFSEHEVTPLYTDIKDSDTFKMMRYDFQKPDFKNFPRLFIRSKGDNFAPAVKKYNLPISTILNIYDKGLYKTENKDNPNYQKSLSKIIEYFKLGIKSHDSYKHFKFKWEDSDKYKNISDFYRDVTRSCYKISWEKINFSELLRLVEHGRIYLFQIYNKDFELDKSIAPENYVYKGKEGKANLHTTYWRALFSERNLEKTVLKLNGQAEIFFRKSSLKPEIDTTRKTKRAITKYKRYTKDKILFHCPITLNFAENKENISLEIRKLIKNNHDIKIIGIDRGEKHLAYYSVVDQRGSILDIGSFNKIEEREDKAPTDYHQKLDEIEKNRDWQRKSWQEISNIKEMKKGYISQVVHQICKLVHKHNAIVVFEDLNIGFKRGRFAIEKQIYQNLELALAKKLNYLVFKDAQEGESGHHLNAFQLTPKIDNFQDIDKQCGIIFYIPASYTSAVCPACGFRKNISTPVEKLKKNKELVEKFDIVYEASKNRFRISYKISDFYKPEKENKKKKEYLGVKLFEEIKLPDTVTFYSDVERLKYQRNDNNRGGEVKDRKPNEELKVLFQDNSIDYKKEPNVSEQIKERKFENESFYKPLIYKIALILQLRNCKTTKNSYATNNEEQARDFISCPHCYFHSENNLLDLPERYRGQEKFEFNGDANGAYNIARKGSLILRKINMMQDLENIDYYKDLTILQEEWDKFVQNRSPHPTHKPKKDVK